MYLPPPRRPLPLASPLNIPVKSRLKELVQKVASLYARTSVDIDIFTRGALSNWVGIILLPSPLTVPPETSRDSLGKADKTGIQYCMSYDRSIMPCASQSKVFLGCSSPINGSCTGQGIHLRLSSCSIYGTSTSTLRQCLHDIFPEEDTYMASSCDHHRSNLHLSIRKATSTSSFDVWSYSHLQKVSIDRW
jgi:hypothetical protein